MFRSGSRAGFTIALGENKAALLWTSTGLVDPEAVETALPHKLVLCEFDTPETRSQTGGLAKVSRCEMGPISFDGIDHFLTADYQGCLRPETPDVCETAISLHYKPLDPERSSARVAFRHSSSRIVAAAVWDELTLDKGHQRPGMALSGRHEGAAKSAGGTLEGDWRSGQNGEGFLFGLLQAVKL